MVGQIQTTCKIDSEKKLQTIYQRTDTIYLRSVPLILITDQKQQKINMDIMSLEAYQNPTMRLRGFYN
ncbi:MAG TPA: hypothetical protein VEJ68_05545 [Candidatus Bathyarchaeia archaeon]|nr:hypothetical protein [Candidatus Bathyarchaeia archaeon]